MSTLRVACLLAIGLGLAAVGAAQDDEEAKPIPKAPPRAEGEGPWKRLILRGVTLIDGTGAPPFGPVDVVVERNRIGKVRTVGFPGVPIDADKRPKAEAGDKEIDLTGQYVLPGFIDMHGHIGGADQGTPAEYVFKLWMGHGITTVRDPGSGNGLAWTLEAQGQSERNEITAPRIFAYVFFGQGRRRRRSARPSRRGLGGRAGRAARRDGLKLVGARPDICWPRPSTRRRRPGCGTACHHAQMDVARINVLDSARLGLDQHGALVRPAGGAVRRPHRPGLPARLQLHRRAASLRPGRPAVEAGGAARQPRSGTR